MTFDERDDDDDGVKKLKIKMKIVTYFSLMVTSSDDRMKRKLIIKSDQKTDIFLSTTIDIKIL